MASDNPWVHNTIWVEFQKHCALYLLLSDYSNFKWKKYFICIEHHDDIIIWFQDTSGKINAIRAYQAKKAWEKWTLDAELSEIIAKLVRVGTKLRKDPAEKADNYTHELRFISNGAIELGDRKTWVVRVNESNCYVTYSELKEDVKASILNKIKNYLQSDDDKGELDCTGFGYIDLWKQTQSQRDQLDWLFKRIFWKSVNDGSAATTALLELFRTVENTLNQKNKAQLLDERKRVSSEQIDEALKIITSKSKAFDTWRDRKSEFSSKLDIPLLERKRFEFGFETSFDFFKDPSNVEHIQILKFVEENIKALKITDETDCVNQMHSKYINGTNTLFDEVQLKAIIFAALIQTLDTHES